MRKVLSFVFSRLVVTGVLLLVQIVWLFLLFNRLSEYAAWINGVGLTVSVIMCLALIRKDSTVPEFKISWLILFTIMPVQGGLLYLLWGDKRPAIRLRRRMERAEERFAPLRTADPAAQAALEARDPRAAETARYVAGLRPGAGLRGHRRQVLPQRRGDVRRHAARFAGGEQSIYVESFIIGMGEMWGQIHEILRQKAAAGLDVRVIYDDRGLPEPFAPQLRRDAAGGGHPGLLLQPVRAAASTWS